MLCLQPTETPPKAPGATPPKDVAAILEAKSIPETKMHFEVLMDGKPVGYHVSTLTPAKGEAGVAYDYRAESILKMENGMRIDGIVIARLKRNFEPVSITLDRQLSHPEAPVRRMEDRAQVGESLITLARQDSASGANPERSVPKPKEPFIFGMEFVVEAIDVTKNATLPIAERNAQDGAVLVYRLVRGQSSGETQEMLLQKSDGGVGYRFTISPTGRIESWGEASTPVAMKRCTEARFNEVKSSIESK
jgi:hypothetical protein